MKKLLLLISILMFTIPSFQARGASDSIQIRRYWFGGESYKYQGKNIWTYHKLGHIMATDPVASTMFKKAKTARAIGAGICLAGAAAGIGYYIYDDQYNRRNNIPYDISFNVPVMILGSAILSVPFTLYADRHTKRAVRKYNGNLHKTAGHSIHPEYYLSIAPNAIGLTMKF
jgi:hypothetical protein